MIISNNEKDRQVYELQKRKFFKKYKSNEARAVEINELLESPSISNSRKLKLQIEREAIKPFESEPETVEYIEGILNPVVSESTEKIPPRKRGRPPGPKKSKVPTVESGQRVESLRLVIRPDQQPKKKH